MSIVAANWSRRVEITDANTSPSLTGFVALVTEANLPSEIWTTALNGGGDLRVCLNSDGTSQLPLEVVSFDTSAQTAVLWLRLPTFVSGDSFWLFYGKAGETQPAVTDPFGRNAVWVDYVGVYHCHDANYTDSTGFYDLSLTGNANPPAIVDGVLGNAYDFNSSDQTQLINSNLAIPISSRPITISMVGTLKATTINTSLGGISGSGGGDDLTLLVGSGNNSVSIGVLRPQSTFVQGSNSPVQPQADYYANAIVTDGDNYRFYGNIGTTKVDGTAQSTFSAAGSVFSRIGLGGRIDGSPDYSSAIISEFRVYQFTPSTDLLDTEYANQSSHATFWSTGTPENTGGGGATVTADVTEASPSFSDSINATLTKELSASITELAPSFADAIESTLTGNTDASITGIAPSFADSISATLTGAANTVQITELLPAFASAINATLTGNQSATITEAAPSFSASLTATTFPAGVTAASIIESAPSFTTAINVTIIGNTTAQINGLAPSFSDVVNASLSVRIESRINELAPSFSASLTATVPSKWIDVVVPSATWTDKTTTSATWINIR